MQLGGDEEALVREQLRHRASIFSCDEYAVLSAKKRELGPGIFTWVNPAPLVPAGEYGVDGATTSSFLNTGTFIQAWDILMGSGKLWRHDWVIKVDPDAVFLPERLHARLSGYHESAVFFVNCGHGGWTGMYGALEVFSRQAIQVYYGSRDTCKDLPWHGWGEDYYMEKCMQALAVWQVLDQNLVSDMNCGADWTPCSDTTKAAFHHYKTPAAYMQCLRAAKA